MAADYDGASIRDELEMAVKALKMYRELDEKEEITKGDSWSIRIAEMC